MRIPELSKSALVLVEFQNQWTQPGLYHRLVRSEVARLGTIDKAEALAAAARSAGAPVIHAPLVVDPRNKRGTFAKLSFGLVFRKGSSAADIDARVWNADDVVADGRTSFDAFVGSKLEDILRASRCEHILFAGFATDQCVAKSVRTAIDRGFDAYLVSDCCATFAPFLHRRVERQLQGMVLSAQQLMPQ